MHLLEEKQNLLHDLWRMKKDSFEQMLLFIIYCLNSYIKSLLKFGVESYVTKDNLKIIKEMFNILKKERKLLNYISKNIDSFNIRATQNVIELLDDLNEKTVLYYYDVIEEIQSACDLKDKDRVIRPNKNFDTLIQSNFYTYNVISLSLNKNIIRSFLNYENEFWDFIKSKDTSNLKINHEIAEKISYAIPILNDDNIIVDIHLLIPEVIDFPTALVAINTYQKAYLLYKNLGQKYPLPNNFIDDTITDNFENVFLNEQINMIFTRKK